MTATTDWQYHVKQRDHFRLMAISSATGRPAVSTRRSPTSMAGWRGACWGRKWARPLWRVRRISSRGSESVPRAKHLRFATG